ncbi:sigma-54-dependent Fis family transcriptional regulator [Acidocella aminolytica]|jgi:transcriptional regulator of acetoin/glycerol metabolism|uniref:Transcriptional regulator Fis n=1 Tax=Acidocella aminolytica 101 = DSM 11237 TaxID=1120923 RepID=A0A0D6PJR4_9PROT|nr:sigma-54-dependent Fis family transcriptional regulator [Acidocella aminolytica]GAN81922.1 transcriptional regulator Fis [Acidocella aminolytica 101 = DSM 11237]GBQ38148.1 Fis family GAF modulated sigma54 specific transcriptional regulator [Acidocella aminolytica 101 = DSM 11237]SHE77039.1 Transcriptional regulator of acetoin/glycerol metabolism [Acidocella aminolytica 101 = DSM 11237]
MSTAEHVREIETAWRGGTSGRDPYVIQSWRRCLDEYHLDPAVNCEAVILPEGRLKEHRQQSEELINIARSGLERLFGHVSGQNYVLLLTNRQGIAVEYFGDPRHERDLRKAGLYLGADWAEARAGTCAVGACIATGEALTIHQTDHFDMTHTPLSCTAAPIYDTTGALSAVLDISLLSSPREKISQSLARHLVTTTTRRIELANLMAQTSRQWVLRFALSPEFLDVDPEGAIAIDHSGRIVGMTNAAARMLAQAAGLDWRQPEMLLGQKVSQFLNLEVDGLPNLTRGRPTHERVLRARDGRMLFAHAIEPPPRSRARPPSAPLPPALREIGQTPEINQLLEKAARFARTTLPVCIHGETGTGKEVMARALHAASGLKGQFVAMNCAAIPETLAEAELFGHVPGAFTGAAPKGRKGLVEAANGGTLFLDEIGDMPLILQTRLLRVLAEQEVQPLGGNNPLPVQIRVISASHRDLAALVAEGRFREDLYYRLHAATLTLPPLRERADFDWLVERLLARHSPTQRRLTPAAWAALRAHHWPGNLRELDHCLAAASALCEDDEITLSDLPETFSGGDPDSEAAQLRAALAQCQGNVSALARRLGVDRTTVHRRMRRLHLKRHG